MDCYELLFAISAVLVICYYYTWTYNYWKTRGIAGPRPHLFFGNFWKIITRNYPLIVALKNWYHEFKHEPVFGVYQGSKPLLVINDLELIKDVLIKDFSSFTNRGIHTNKKVSPHNNYVMT